MGEGGVVVSKKMRSWVLLVVQEFAICIVKIALAFLYISILSLYIRWKAVLLLLISATYSVGNSIRMCKS